MITLKKYHIALIVLVVATLIFLAFKLNQDSTNLAAKTEVEAESQTTTKAALTVDLVKPSLTLMNQNIAANGSDRKSVV